MKICSGAIAFHHEVASTPHLQNTFSKLGQGQAPDTFVITCCDSRIDPNLILNRGPGELFVFRSIGNIIPPPSSPEATAAAAAVEYAISQLKVRTIAVIGHSGCGAMAGVLCGVDANGAPHLSRWLAPDTTCLPHPPSASEPDALSRTNVLQQLENLRSYPLVEQACQQGDLELVGMWFDIGSATMHQADLQTQTYAPLVDPQGTPAWSAPQDSVAPASQRIS